MDFKKLRAARQHAPVVHPVEIFRRLPKPPGINDLYVSQAQALESWHERRNEKDVVLKLHTGGGKTLVGLLIAQSILNEGNGPVVYLAANNQLVEQTLSKAQEYNISAVAYDKSPEFNESFVSGKSVLVGSYQALFNGKSRFGVRGRGNIQQLGGIVLDDAHVAFSTVRNQFTLRINRATHTEAYQHLTTLFRHDFEEMGLVGTFDDVVKGSDFAVMEVPYWGWKAKSAVVRQFLGGSTDAYTLVWPLLRDSFDYCHCLISQDAVVITPILPLVDMIPAFADCPRRIFMSATIGDDSAIVRTFDANPQAVGRPISPHSLAGVSERMILVPELMDLQNVDISVLLRRMATWAATQQKAGVVILTPSGKAAEKWQDIGTVVSGSDEVAKSVRQLQSGESTGPFVFANRYDGIDLPGQACRLLIFSNLPSGASEYDLFRGTVFKDGFAINSELAQRIEQGIGRGARGAGDYCVVILVGKGLVAWMNKPGNWQLLTSSTRAQLEMGFAISKDISDTKALREVVVRCFSRDKEWLEFHAEMLADAVHPDSVNHSPLDIAGAERSAFRLMRDGYFEKAISKLEKICASNGSIDAPMKGWLLQLAARAALYWDNSDHSLQLQQQAYSTNNYLLRPRVMPPYVPLVIPGKQAEQIVKRLGAYRQRRAYLASFDDEMARLVPEATAGQFEEALSKLGLFLGYATERPDSKYKQGPDVLWLLNDTLALVIEAKSRKNDRNALTKEQHGQLLNATVWFTEKYPGRTHIRVSVHPNVTVTPSTVPGETKALTLAKLSELVADTRQLLSELCESAHGDDTLTLECERLIAKLGLTPEALATKYLVPFTASIQ